MARLTRSEALDILGRAHVPAGSDFHKLGTADVEALLAEADRRKYRRPANANGSRARSFHAYLERAASRPVDAD